MVVAAAAAATVTTHSRGGNNSASRDTVSTNNNNNNNNVISSSDNSSTSIALPPLASPDVFDGASVHSSYSTPTSRSPRSSLDNHHHHHQQYNYHQHDDNPSVAATPSLQQDPGALSTAQGQPEVSPSAPGSFIRAVLDSAKSRVALSGRHFPVFGRLDKEKTVESTTSAAPPGERESNRIGFVNPRMQDGDATPFGRHFEERTFDISDDVRPDHWRSVDSTRTAGPMSSFSGLHKRNFSLDSSLDPPVQDSPERPRVSVHDRDLRKSYDLDFCDVDSVDSHEFTDALEDITPQVTPKVKRNKSSGAGAKQHLVRNDETGYHQQNQPRRTRSRSNKRSASRARSLHENEAMQNAREAYLAASGRSKSKNSGDHFYFRSGSNNEDAQSYNSHKGYIDIESGDKSSFGNDEDSLIKDDEEHYYQKEISSEKQKKTTSSSSKSRSRRSGRDMVSGDHPSVRGVQRPPRGSFRSSSVDAVEEKESALNGIGDRDKGHLFDGLNVATKVNVHRLAGNGGVYVHRGSKVIQDRTGGGGFPDVTAIGSSSKDADSGSRYDDRVGAGCGVNTDPWSTEDSHTSCGNYGESFGIYGMSVDSDPTLRDMRPCLSSARLGISSSRNSNSVASNRKSTQPSRGLISSRVRPSQSIPGLSSYANPPASRRQSGPELTSSHPSLSGDQPFRCERISNSLIPPVHDRSDRQIRHQSDLDDFKQRLINLNNQIALSRRPAQGGNCSVSKSRHSVPSFRQQSSSVLGPQSTSRHGGDTASRNPLERTADTSAVGKERKGGFGVSSTNSFESRFETDRSNREKRPVHSAGSGGKEFAVRGVRTRKISPYSGGHGDSNKGSEEVGDVGSKDDVLGRKFSADGGGELPAGSVASVDVADIDGKKSASRVHAVSHA